MRKLHSLCCLAAWWMTIIAASFIRALSQTPDPLNNSIIPPSPTAAALGKYGAMPVSLNTGIPQISVPLYTITEGSLQVPLSLSYHAAGIKVEELASYVGLGWSLNAGGIISRTVMGLPDETAIQGFLDSKADLPADMLLSNSVESEYNIMAEAAYWHTRDTEPDEFFFNMAGYSGKFVLSGKDENGYVIARQIPYADIRIRALGSLPGFQITSPDGTTFLFGNYDAAYLTDPQIDPLLTPAPRESTISELVCGGSGSFAGPFTSSWLLTTIISPVGDVVNFRYEPYVEYYGIGLNETHTTPINNWEDCEETITECYSYLEVTGFRLVAIRSANVLIEFHNDTEREDLTESKALTYLEVFSVRRDPLGQEVLERLKSYHLDYDYYVANQYSPVAHYKKRLRLLQVYEAGAEGTLLPPWKFTYDETALPLRISKAQDLWGYYNGRTSNITLIQDEPENCPAADVRETVPEFTKAGILTGIEAPTGGGQLFEYEVNDYSSINQGSELQIEATEDMMAHATASVHTVPADTFDFFVSHGQFATVTASTSMPCVCEVTYSIFNLDLNKEVLANEGTSCQWLDPGNHRIVVEAIGSEFSNAFSSVFIYYRNHTGNQVRKVLASGLRIRKTTVRKDMQVASEDDQIQHYFYYAYDDSTRSSGVLIIKPDLDFNTNLNIYPDHPVTCLLRNRTSLSQVILLTSNSNPVSYTDVQVVFGDAVQGSWPVTGENGRSRHLFSYALVDRTNVFPNPPIYNPDWKRGLALETWTYDRNNQLVSGSKNEYQTEEVSANYYEIHAVKIGTSQTDPVYGADWGFGAPLTLFASEPYAYTSQWIYKQKQISNLYFPDGSVSSDTTWIYYDNPDHANPTRTVTNRSDGNKSISYARYPSDFDPADYPGNNVMRVALDSMANGKHIHNSVVEQYTFLVHPVSTSSLGGSKNHTPEIGSSVNGNILSLLQSTEGVFQSSQKITNYEDTLVVGGALTQFRIHSGIPLKDSVFQLDVAIPLNRSDFSVARFHSNGTFEKDKAYRAALIVDRYSSTGKPEQYHKPFGQPTSAIYSVPSGNVQAVFTNSEYNSVAYSGFECENAGGFGFDLNFVKEVGTHLALEETISGNRYFDLGVISRNVNLPGWYRLTFWSTAPLTIGGYGFETAVMQQVGETIRGFTFYEYEFHFTAGSGAISLSGNGAVDEVLFYPSYAFATTYSWKPLTGLTEVSDENSYIQRYQYDEFGRLQYAEDHFGNGLACYEYHFKDDFLPDDQNYIRNVTASQPGLTLEAMQSGNLEPEQANQTIQFLDGLGRPQQEILCGFSPAGHDLIGHLEYDEFGRQPRKYLVYPSFNATGLFRSQAAQELQNYYHTTEEVENTSFPFAEARWDGSPMNRLLSEAFPGESWQMDSANKKHVYRMNGANEVRRFQYDAGSETWISNGFYRQGTISVEEITDENGSVEITFKDKAGKQILHKRSLQESGGDEMMQLTFISTGYIYDELDRLRVVVTPESFREMESSNVFAISGNGNEWDYFYEYNERGLQKAKKLPGTEWHYTVYDQLDRPVLLQHPNLRMENKWSFQKFDRSGRAIISGLVTIATQTADELQAELWTDEVICYETRTGSETGYTNVAYPTTQLEELSLTYYDDYDFNSDGQNDFSPVQADPARNRNKNTGGRMALLEEPAVSFIKSASFYDYQGRPVETQVINASQHHENEFSEYDFMGNLLIQTREHPYTKQVNPYLFTTDVLTRTIRNEYDHAGRLRNSYIKLNDEPEYWVLALTYNELGQAVKRKLGNQTAPGGWPFSSKPLQTIDYVYNIRGWLTGINNLDDVENGRDFFAMDLNYNSGHLLLDVPARFDGNISWIAWRTSRDQHTHLYGFSYDGLDRLVKANYVAQEGPMLMLPDRYTVDDLQYDQNGNILSMKVFGAVQLEPTTGVYSYGINDHLTYTYQGNRLLSVTDAVLPILWQGSNDFRDVPGVVDYLYDGNGNMISDVNKAISVDYNHLNLPQLITKGDEELQVTYDASGTKHREVSMELSGSGDTRYFGDIIQENGKPARVLFSDGYFCLDTSGRWIPYYYIKDQLGNVRVVFRGETLEWTKTQLTFEIQENEEGTEFPKFQNVAVSRNGEMAYQGEFSGKLNNQEGPYTEFEVLAGDSIIAGVQYLYLKANQGKENPYQPDRQPRQYMGVELRPQYQPGVHTDHGYEKAKPVPGLQLTFNGLLSSFGRQKQEGLQRSDSLEEAPDAYLIFSLRDSSGNEVQQWQSEIDSANQWLCLTDSIGIHSLDSGMTFKLKVSLVNNSEEDVWFDTLYLKVGQPADPVVQVNHYYPFGNLIPDLSWQSEQADSNVYLYNAKEWHRSLNLNWLDYGARWYDPQVGRWWVVDPAAIAYASASPYCYVLNNTVNAIDPNGNLVIFVNGFMPSQWVNADNRKMIPAGRWDEGFAVGQLIPNSRYKPYPGERSLAQGSPTYLGQHFSYWGNEVNPKAGIGGVISQGFNDYNTRFISSSSDNASQAKDRFTEGIEAGINLMEQIDDGSISMADGETIKIIGHSQGAAFAAGIATILAQNPKYASLIEAVMYIAPHQPTDFSHPAGVPGNQWSTHMDWISGGGWDIMQLFNGHSEQGKIEGIEKNNYALRDSQFEGMGGHSVDTYIDNLTKYFKKIGIAVNVIE